MKLYTKTGDKGTTGLSGGSRVSKSNARIIALGDIDELNAMLGLCRTLSVDSIFEYRLASVQSILFAIGAEISYPSNARKRLEILAPEDVATLEESIDQQEEELEPLTSFILPGGSSLAAHFHLARAISRRAERSVVTLGEHEAVRELVLRYLNRLSDWLFIAARTANRHSNVEDIKWKRE
jgi:cob(I)alamin adenosyltransferase